MKLHIVIHEYFESPGAIEKWANDQHHEISYTRLDEGDTLPTKCSDFDFLIVLGGPQSPATTKDECAHFDSQKEQALIKAAIDAGKLVLGVCLGAQLMGEALGARFEHSPHREIGVFDISLTDDGADDPIFSRFPKQFPVGHWHGDMPGLTADAKVLATSAGCPRQIIRYAPNAYAFQCHFEFTRESIEAMLQCCAHDLDAESDYIQGADAIMAHDYNFINEYLFVFLNQFQQGYQPNK